MFIRLGLYVGISLMYFVCFLRRKNKKKLEKTKIKNKAKAN